MLRYDVLARTFETVFDVTSLLGGGKYLWQMHSSSDDRVHSATVKDSNTYQDLGCLVYREDTRQHLFFTPRGDYDECQIDKSGRWLVIKENVDNQYNEDNRIIDIETGAEQVLWDQDGAAGHSDMGYGYIVGEDDKWAANPYGVRVWQFGPNMTSAGGRLVYAMPSWNGPGVGHIAHSNSKAGLPFDQQMACSSNAGDSESRPHQRDRLLSTRRLDAGAGRGAEHDRPECVGRRRRRLLEAAEGQHRPDRRVFPLDVEHGRQSRRRVHRAHSDAAARRAPAPRRHRLPRRLPLRRQLPHQRPHPLPRRRQLRRRLPRRRSPIPFSGCSPSTCTATANNLVKTGGCDGCPDASAVSSGQVSGNGIAQFVAAGSRRRCGTSASAMAVREQRRATSTSRCACRTAWRRFARTTPIAPRSGSRPATRCAISVDEQRRHVLEERRRLLHERDAGDVGAAAARRVLQQRTAPSTGTVFGGSDAPAPTPLRADAALRRPAPAPTSRSGTNPGRRNRPGPAPKLRLQRPPGLRLLMRCAG